MRVLLHTHEPQLSARVWGLVQVLASNDHLVLIAPSGLALLDEQRALLDRDRIQLVDIPSAPDKKSRQDVTKAIEELRADAVLIGSDEAVPNFTKFKAPIFKLGQDGSIESARPYPKGRRHASNRLRQELVRLSVETTSFYETESPLRLAMLSPVLPAKSGIANYTADLLPVLERHYNITLVDTTPEQLRDWAEEPSSQADVRDMSWFLANAGSFDRVVYQLGNSGFHAGMLGAIARIPGVVVLHDFFIGHYLWWEQDHHNSKLAYETLRDDHGFKALQACVHRSEQAILAYPGSLQVFRDALSVIVHSKFARSLTEKWYGSAILEKVNVIPLLKNVTDAQDRQAVRGKLGILPGDFVVCSFGFIGPYKMSDRIIKAWAKSEMAGQPNCKLIFVGENHASDYGMQILDEIQTLPDPSQVSITGFASIQTFHDYLVAADLGIQLRQNSRGETSGAVLDAMSHGLPQIVNANGSFAELDPQAVLMLPDEFEDALLVQAMNRLYQDAQQRSSMSLAAKRCILEQHAPEICAAQYRDVIETAYSELNIVKPRTARLFLDVTATHHSTLMSGIERVALALCRALINLEPNLGMVTPVYLTQNDGQWVHCQANDLIGKQLGIPDYLLKDQSIEPAAGDVLLSLDLAPTAFYEAAQDGLFERYRELGVKQYSVVYDLLPIRMPDVFPPGSSERHAQWLNVVAGFDGALCISEHVAKDLNAWRAENGYTRSDYRIGHFMLGADTGTFGQNPVRYKPPTVTPLKRLIHKSRLTFLMVGTIEPRKGYLEVLDTFEALWERGFDFRLVIVGREGWKGLPHYERRDIPHTLFRFNTHPEKYHRLIWIGNADDRKLEEAYEQADCLIAASYDEGFGLPIIEAAQRAIPIIARDIPVFREVAPPFTTFFKTGGLADAIIWWRRPENVEHHLFSHRWQDSGAEVLEWLSAAVDGGSAVIQSTHAELVSCPHTDSETDIS